MGYRPRYREKLRMEAWVARRRADELLREIRSRMVVVEGMIPPWEGESEWGEPKEKEG